MKFDSTALPPRTASQSELHRLSYLSPLVHGVVQGMSCEYPYEANSGVQALSLSQTPEMSSNMPQKDKCQTSPEWSSFDETSRESELPRPLTLRRNLELLHTFALESMR